MVFKKTSQQQNVIYQKFNFSRLQNVSFSAVHTTYPTGVPEADLGHIPKSVM